MCRYVTNYNPLLYIQPVKEEELYLDPYIAIYHDVASNKEMDILKELVYPSVGIYFAYMPVDCYVISLTTV